MPDLLQKALSWLDGKRKQHASQMVEYARGPHSIEVAATVGQTTFEVEERGGYVRVQSRDFLISTEDLDFGGGPTLPERGDRIRESDGGKTFVYEVLAPGAEPHYRYSDPYRQILRIHTKHVATEGV